MSDQVEIREEASLQAKSVGLDVRLSTWGNLRKIPSGSFDSQGADPGMLRHSKKLVKSSNLDKIQSLRAKLGKDLDSISLPCSMFRHGVRLISVKAIGRAQEILAEYLGEGGLIPTEVDAFIQEYPDLIKESEGTLGSLFDPTEYPAPGTIRGYFDSSFRYFSFGTPDALKSISEELFSAELQKAQDSFKDAEREIREALRVGFQELVARLIERLTPDSDGKKKIFHESFVDGFKEFLDTFALRDVSNDEELSALIERARGIVSGVSVDALRNDSGTRQTVLQSMQGVAMVVDGIVPSKRSRRVKLGDREAA